jgi:hypothetical protein
MDVVIINRELYKDKQYQIMTRAGSGYNHIFPGKLFTLEQATGICKKSNFNILKIGNMWECLI